MIQIGKLQFFIEQRELRRDGAPLHIGSRALDILELLVNAKGSLVSKDQIMRAVWPDTVVEENNLQVHIVALRKALGEDRELIRTIPGRGYRLLFAEGTQNAEPHCEPRSPPDETAIALPVRDFAVPSSASVLIGRQDDVLEVTAALERSQIVTLVGAGGIGKTRLAAEVAKGLAAKFPGGIVFVPLAAVTDARFVLDALATALGMKLSAGRLSLAHIADEMQGRHALIVLDNCEHVIEAAAEAAVVLEGASGTVRILATSREALRVQNEVLYQVPALQVPDQQSLTDEVLQTSGVQLFLARAHALDPRFSSDERSIFLTGQVCRCLDGIPLAIELAAARAAVLGIDVLADHLGDRFRILTGGCRTALPRHQTLKATMDWSYRLLDDKERTILRYLGVFVNGFTFDAVNHVIADNHWTPVEIMDALGGLVSKSMVILECCGSLPRFRLLETTRAYALQQLTDNGERKRAALAHATYFCELFDRVRKHWAERPVSDSLADFCHELGNLRTALDWAFSPSGERSVGIELSAVAVPYLFELSLVEECCERARQALDAAQDETAYAVSPMTRLRLGVALASGLVYTVGPTKDTHDRWSDVLSLAIAVGDAHFESRAVWGLWNAHQYGGEAHEALLLARRFNALAQQHGDTTNRVIGRRIEGIALHYAGEQAAAREQLEGMLNTYVPAVHRWNALGFRIDHGIVARATLARVLWVQGETERALRLAEIAAEAAQDYAHEMVTCYVLVEALVPIALMMGERDIAARALAMLRDIASRVGFSIWLSACSCYEEYLFSVVPGEHRQRLALFRLAIDKLHETGFLAPLTFLLCRFAQAQADYGRFDEAMTAINEALRHCERTGERWYYAEICRVKGAIVQMTGGGGDAGTWFLAGLESASRQGAGALEVRAASSLANWLAMQGRRAEALSLLSPVCTRFPEHRGWGDVHDAHELLRSLKAPTLADDSQPLTGPNVAGYCN
ncbi:ATP-binding protein [Paraburkholderia phytofirmans]|uniref:ATP-binding protein n=1 Tax=Paraburkholderia phytofirmans TaxID=261302 RepID=UPI0007B609AB|nr:winged helix-turn-helix domain-containing protein [Paraburkholderia phytofirmans]